MEERCESALKKYKIAVIIAGIDQTYQSSILNGIAASAKECLLDIYVFVSFSGTMGNPGHDTGELNIFNLPDLSEFSGAVLLTNTIDYQPVVEKILKKIRDAAIPAVSIDYDDNEMFHIGIDNKSAMREITEHFISVHNVKKFGYISGPEGNPESEDRFSAFMEVLENNGLRLDDKFLYNGDFRGPSGKRAIEKFLAADKDMPEAIICANDVMAVSAIDSLMDAGYSVPQQIKVSGFDNTYSNHNYKMELTTVERPLEEYGRIACKMLRDSFDGRKTERSVTLSMSTRFMESCGCCREIIPDAMEMKKLNCANFNKHEALQNYMGLFNSLSCRLLGCNNYDEYISEFRDFVSLMNPEEFYFCLCDNWNSELFDEKNIVHSLNEHMVTEFTDEIRAAIAYRDGDFLVPVTIPRKQLIPYADESGSTGKFYYIVPIHFGERCLGYMVLRNTKMNLHTSMFQSWCITISNSVENIRKILSLDSAVQHLSKLYAQDTFVGIFNRNGFIQATMGVYEDCVKNKRNIMLMFIDLDGLKRINDNLGHDVGDEAICDIANVLIESCVKDEVYCRFGGDEFIIFAPDRTEKDAVELTALIQENISNLNKRRGKYRLSASTGFIIAVPKEGEDLFKFVTEADKVMYKEKKNKKLHGYGRLV